MVQPEASRSSSAEFLLFLPPVPIPSGRLKKAACLLRTVSETSPEGLRPFPVPEQSSPVAGGTLQTLATGFCSVSYCNATKCRKCPVFLMRWIDKNGLAVPWWEAVSGRKDLQYRFAIEMNRFNRRRSASSPGNHDQTATIDFHRPDVRFRVAGGNRWDCSRETYNKRNRSASPAPPNCSRDSKPPVGRSARRCVPQATSKRRNCGPIGA